MASQFVGRAVTMESTSLGTTLFEAMSAENEFSSIDVGR